jgi:chromosome segregation ATPase
MLEINTQQLQTTHKDFSYIDDFQKTISTIIDSSPNFDAFKANLIQKFESFTVHINDNVDTLKKGFETTKKVCGEKFDIAKIKALKQTSDLYNAIKDFFALIYNYTLGIIAGKIEYTRQQKIAASEFSTEIKKLEGIAIVAELKQQVESKEALIKQLETKHQTFETEAKNLQDRLSKSEGENQNAIAELKQQVESKEALIKQLETKHQTFQTEAKKLQDELANKQAELSKLEKDQEEIRRLKEEIANFSKAEGENQNVIVALQQQLKSKEEQIEQFKKTKPTLERDVKTLRDELAKKQAELTKSEKDIENKKAELTKLESTLTNKQKELKSLETQIKSKQDEIAQLNAKKKTESEKLEAEKNKLIANKQVEVEKLDGQIKTMQNEIKKLKQEKQSGIDAWEKNAKTEVENKIKQLRKDETQKMIQEVVLEKQKMLDTESKNANETVAKILQDSQERKAKVEEECNNMEEKFNNLKIEVAKLLKTKKENTPSILGYILGYPQKAIAEKLKRLEEKLKGDLQAYSDSEKRALMIETEAFKKLIADAGGKALTNINNSTLEQPGVQDFKNACQSIQNYVSPQKPLQDGYLSWIMKKAYSQFNGQSSQQTANNSWTSLLNCRKRQQSNQLGQ